MLLVYRNPPEATAIKGSHIRLELARQEWIAVSLAGFVWMTYNAGYIVLVSFLPGLFTANGYSLSQAGLVVSFLGWLLIPSVPVVGALAERLGRPRLFLVGGLLAAGLAAAALPFAREPVIPFGILAVVIGAPAGLIMALP